MKKNLLWSLAALFVTAALSMGFASCSDDDDDDNPFVGTWESEEFLGSYFNFLSYQFKADGTYILEKEQGKTTKALAIGKWRRFGTYKVSGNKLTLKENREFEQYDEKEGKWVSFERPYDDPPYVYYFKIEENTMYWYIEADVEMTSPYDVFKKK